MGEGWNSRSTTAVVHLHLVSNGDAVGQDFRQRLGAENVPQDRLSEELSGIVGVGDVDDAEQCGFDAEIDDRVDVDRHRVLRQNLLQMRGSKRECRWAKGLTCGGTL